MEHFASYRANDLFALVVSKLFKKKTIVFLKKWLQSLKTWKMNCLSHLNSIKEWFKMLNLFQIKMVRKFGEFWGSSRRKGLSSFPEEWKKLIPHFPIIQNSTLFWHSIIRVYKIHHGFERTIYKFHMWFKADVQT